MAGITRTAGRKHDGNLRVIENERPGPEGRENLAGMRTDVARAAGNKNNGRVQRQVPIPHGMETFPA